MSYYEVADRVLSNIEYLMSKNRVNKCELARNLGCDSRVVRRWLNDGWCPSVGYLIDISNYFMVSLDDLVKKDLNKEK